MAFFLLNIPNGTIASPFTTISQLIVHEIASGLSDNDTVKVYLTAYSAEWGTLDIDYDFVLEVSPNSSKRCKEKNLTARENCVILFEVLKKVVF